MGGYKWSNCPVDVRRQIEHLIEKFQRHLGENLVGIYLHGSLSTGCFNPLRSDLDLLVVTKHKLTKDNKRDLAKLLLDASAKPRPIEISFLNQKDLSLWRHPAPFDFHYSEDWREKFEHSLTNEKFAEWSDTERFDDDLAAHITVTNHRGICLYGEPISRIFPPIPERDFLDSVLGDVFSSKYGLDAAMQYPAYVVLNACRTFAYLRTRQVMSKIEGGEWALQNLPAQYHETIAKALNSYQNQKKDGEFAKEELTAFADYMKRELKQFTQ